MVNIEEIQALGEAIVQIFHPERIVLFGSYAYGSPNQDSDVDLLIVINHEGKASRKAAEILSSVQTNFPIDVVVRSSAELAHRLSLNDYFLHDVVNHGKLLYAATDL